MKRLNRFLQKSLAALVAVTAAFLPFQTLAAQISPEDAAVSVTAFERAEFAEVLVKYKGHDDFRVIEYTTNAEAAAALTALKRDPLVDIAQPNYKYYAAAIPNDSLLSDQKHLPQIKASEGWEFASGSPDVIVAVIDSGVDISHPDLQGNIWKNAREVKNGNDDDGNGYVDDTNGWDFLTDAPDPGPKGFKSTPEDAIGIQHGTMVAGIIAARGNNATGVAGVTWEAQIMPLRVLNHLGIGNSEMVTVALEYAMNNGADIINMSLVGTDFDPIVERMLTEAYERGVIVIAAAGNNGVNLNAVPTYPVCYEHLGHATVIGVGAVDNAFKRPGFSNYGDDCVDIVAPGVNVFSTRHVLPSFADQSRYKSLFSGTSFAAPQVTGVVALMKQMNPAMNSEQALFFLQEGATLLDELHTAGSGFQRALNAEGTLGLFAQTVPEPGEEGEQPGPVIPQPPAEKDEFLVYPLGEFGSVAFQYELPGPLLQTPIVFEGDLFGKGMRMTQNTPYTVLLSAWRGGSKPLYRYNLITREMDLLFEVPVQSEQTVGQVVTGNVDFDHFDEVIVGSGPDAKPLVSIYDDSGHLKFQFQAFDDSVRGGLSVDLLDINGDDLLEIAVTPVADTDGHVKIFDYSGLLLSEWIAYENFGGGATLSTGDYDNDGVIELFVGPGSSGGPHVKIFSPQGDLEMEFFAGDVIDAGGAHLELFDFDRDGTDDFVLTFKEAGTPVIRLYDVQGNFRSEYGVMDGDYRGGIGIVLLK